MNSLGRHAQLVEVRLGRVITSKGRTGGESKEDDEGEADPGCGRVAVGFVVEDGDWKGVRIGELGDGNAYAFCCNWVVELLLAGDRHCCEYLYPCAHSRELSNVETVRCCVPQREVRLANLSAKDRSTPRVSSCPTRDLAISPPR